MNLSTYKYKNKSDKKILFPLLQCWNPVTRVATIAAQVDGRRVSCKISESVLQKKYNSSMDDPMDAVTVNRTQIESAARKLIENKDFEEDGSIEIKYKDL